MDDVLSGRDNSGPYKRPNFPMEFKRQLPEQSFEPGASVALIARQKDINANLLFKWRRQYLQGAYGLPTVQANAAPVSQQETQTPLLPVTVIDDVAKPLSVPLASTATTDGEVCEVEFDHARLRISGEVSPSVLRLLVRELFRTPADAR
ncbi:MAG: transposase [Formivibrio sp.]|nr:transposase [Formivibrio sp.]